MCHLNYKLPLQAVTGNTESDSVAETDLSAANALASLFTSEIS